MARTAHGVPAKVWALLVLWAAVWAFPHAPRTAVSWRFFDLGSRMLWSPSRSGGLHLYAAHPALQFGPVALLAASIVRLAGTEARLSAVAAMTALGFVVLGMIHRLQIEGAPRVSRGRVVAAALVFLPVWVELSVHYAHIDDALALLFVVLACRALARHRNVLAPVLLALAADSKPWAIAFVPLLLVLPQGARLRAFSLWGAAVAVAWLPFLLADPRTLDVTGFAIPNSATSALRAIGFTTRVTPTWDRPVQLALGCVIAAAAVRSRRWPAAVFAAIAIRILIDPGTYAYYTAGLVLAALLVDLYLTRSRVPVFALTALSLVYVVRALPIAASTLGDLRATYCIVAVATVFFLPPLPRRPANAGGPRRSTAEGTVALSREGLG